MNTLKKDIREPKECNFLWICDFGNRHEVHDTCDCPEKYKVPMPVFRSKLYEIFGTYKEEIFNGKPRTILIKPIYSGEITEAMRQEVLRKIFGTW